MKWYTTLTISAILVINITYTAKSQPFHGGLVMGITASQVDGDSYAGFNKVGMHGGVFVNVMFTRVLGAQLEIKYTGRGAGKPVTSEDPEVYKLNLHYIDLPLMMDIVIKERFVIEAGLVPGYLFSASGEDSGGKLPKDFLVDFHKFDLGTLLGLRFKIIDKLYVAARHSYSLRSIRDIETAGAYYTWLGNLFGYRKGDYNNYLSFALYYQIR